MVLSRLIRDKNLKSCGKTISYLEDKSHNVGIYKWLNKTNNKNYVGQSKDLHFRKLDFKCFNTDYAGDLINNARKKYNSSDYWDYEILEYCTKEDLDNREIYYINYYKSDDRRFGYNLNKGGCGNKGYELSETARNKIINSDYNIKRSKPIYQINEDGVIVNKFRNANEIETKLGFQHFNILQCCKNVYKQFYGYKWLYVEDYKEDKDYSFKYSKNRKILQYNLEGELINIWDNLTTAAKSLNITKTAINNVIKHKMNTCLNYIFCYEGEKPNINFTDRRTIKCPILQYDLNDNLIKEWESASNAEIHYTGKRTGSINKVLRGINKSAFGFKWRYK